MKSSFVKGLVVVALSLLLIPIVPAIISHFTADEPAIPAYAPIVEAEQKTAYQLLDEVRVYDVVSQTSATLSVEEYMVESVCASISADAEPEMLKAQAVMMYTYILGRRLEEVRSPTPELYGCDISTDTNRYTPLMPKAVFDAMYKDKAEDYLKKIEEAVESVMGEYIAYGGLPIVPAYCFSCGGITESAQSVLGEAVGYLGEVESEFDSDYKTDVMYTQEELFARITTQPDGITFLGDPSDWLNITKTTDTGYVLEVTLDSTNVVTGAQLAQWLNLPSPRFTVSYSEEFESFTFKVYGSGHLVGLSQYGANKMAKEGMSHTEILEYFYSGAKVCESVSYDQK